MASLAKLEHEIASLKGRNSKVESDKAWETSWTRRLLLSLFTYLAIGFYLQAINIPQPWQNAIVPALAFMLSTLTLPYFKGIWLGKMYRK